MRHVIFITGITASGKTTVASRLASSLDVPYLPTDIVYSVLAEIVGFDEPPKLVMPENWQPIPNITNLKRNLYKLILAGVKGDVIIEGFNLFFRHDREAIAEALHELTGEFWLTTFWLDPPLEQWLVQAEKKYGYRLRPSPYEEHRQRFEPPDQYYTIRDPQVLFVDHVPYQREGLTDEKWRRLQFDPAGKTVLDLGCNDGWMGKYCLAGGAERVVGVDRNWRYLEEARKKGVETVLADLESYRIGEQYDAVLMLATLQHIKDKERLLKEIAEHTQELVLEMPVWRGKPGLRWWKREEYSYLTPTKDYVLKWLNGLFERVEEVGESVAPDVSYRLIFKAYNG